MSSTVPSFLRNTPTPPEFRSARTRPGGGAPTLILNPQMRSDDERADLSAAHDRIDQLFASL